MGPQFSFRRRVPVVLQAEAAECGMACLAMILAYHGNDVDLATLRRRYALSLKGMTMRNLMSVANQMNMASRALRVELDDLPQLALPCILHWGLNHFVVLHKVSSRSIELHDPARGRRTVSFEEVSREFTGIALEINPTVDFTRKKHRPALRLRDLFRNIGGIRSAALQVLTLSLGLELVSILLPIASQIIVDEAIVNADRDLLVVVGCSIVILLFVQFTLGLFRAWTLILAGSTITCRWSSSLFGHLSRLPLDYFEKRHVGDVISRFESLAAIEKTLTTDLTQGVLDGAMSALMLVMLYFYGGTLVAVVVGFALLNATVRVFAYRAYRESIEETIVAEARQHSHFIETVRGVASVKLLNLSERRLATWMNQFVVAMNAKIRLQRAESMFQQSNELLGGGCHLVLMLLGANAVMNQTMSFGMLIAFLAFSDQFTHRVGDLVRAAFQVRMLKVQVERVADIAAAEPETSSPGDGSAGYVRPCLARPMEGSRLSAVDLSARYSADEPWLFRELSLDIAAGSCFAITGPSGCGKSTLMRILMGLTTPTSGSILLDGRDIRSLGSDSYRRCIAGVMQNDGLFAGSIAENIACFDESPDFGWVEECAARAAILDDIHGMPMAFETLVGDMGSTLSGGQKQRVILARALYRRPQILFLDEATSHLDEATEAVIADALKDLRMTRVVIAHRPATIEHADQAFTMRLSKMAAVAA